MKRRSISERLKKAKSIETKQEVALDWAASWQAEHDQVFKRLEAAIRNDNYDELCIATGQLKVVNEKKFTALPNVIRKLTEPDQGQKEE